MQEITKCIKFMHQNYDIEAHRMVRLYTAIIKEFKSKTKPTHVPEDIFASLA